MQAIKPGTTFTIMQALGINEAIRSIANTINKNSPYVEAKPLNLFFDTLNAILINLIVHTFIQSHMHNMINIHRVK